MLFRSIPFPRGSDNPTEILPYVFFLWFRHEEYQTTHERGDSRITWIIRKQYSNDIEGF